MTWRLWLPFRSGQAARSPRRGLVGAAGSALLALAMAGLAACGDDESDVTAKASTDMTVAEYEASVAHAAAASGASSAPPSERHTDKTGARIERGQITLIEALAPTTSDRKSRPNTRTAQDRQTDPSASDPARAADALGTPKPSGVDPALAQWAQRPSQDTPGGYRVVVRLEDGETREFVQPVIDGLTVGDFVQVVRNSVAPT